MGLSKPPFLPHHDLIKAFSQGGSCSLCVKNAQSNFPFFSTYLVTTGNFEKWDRIGMSKKGSNVFPEYGIKLFWMVLPSILLLAGVASADLSLQTLRCASSTTVIGNNSDTTDFACGTAGIPLKIGLLGNTSSPTIQNVRIGTAAFGHGFMPSS